MRYSSTDWSIDIPDTWRVTEDPECATFEPTSGDSAVQVSAYRKDSAVTDEDLREFAGDVPLTPASLPQFSGFESTSTDDQFFSRKLWLRAGQSMLFLTHTCSLAARGRENATIEALLRSLSPSHATPAV